MSCKVSAEICAFLVEQPDALPDTSVPIHQQMRSLSCWKTEKNESVSWNCAAVV